MLIPTITLYINFRLYRPLAVGKCLLILSLKLLRISYILQAIFCVPNIITHNFDLQLAHSSDGTRAIASEFNSTACDTLI